jgi:hypothetical protein
MEFYALGVLLAICTVIHLFKRLLELPQLEYRDIERAFDTNPEFQRVNTAHPPIAWHESPYVCVRSERMEIFYSRNERNGVELETIGLLVSGRSGELIIRYADSRPLDVTFHGAKFCPTPYLWPQWNRSRGFLDRVRRLTEQAHAS